MTPDLMNAGAQQRADYDARRAQQVQKGGYGRPLATGEVVFTQGVALYLQDVTVSFDGFKALNKARPR